MDIDLIKRTVGSVKLLEKLADEKDRVNILTPAKDLSENAVQLINMAVENNLSQIAADMRDCVRETIATAKTVLTEGSDQSFEKFKLQLKEISKVLVNLMIELKKRFDQTNVWMN